MQLKSAKMFNKKLIKKLLMEEDEFISNIFSGMPLPAQDIVALNYKSFLQNRNKFQKKEFGNSEKKAKTLEELQAKIDELKNKKLNYKEKLQKKGLKNRINKKTKKDQRQKDKKRAKLEQKSVQESKIKEEGDGEDEKPKISKPKAFQKPIFNSQGHMVFSKFDFSGIGSKKKVVKSEKDPKKMLEQITEKTKKLKDMVQAGEQEKAVEIKEKEAWKVALAKSAGEKVKDDPQLLKKTIKREEHKKLKSRKKWEARKHETQSAIDKRQQKRSENIMKRKKDVKKTKLKKAVKKGRIIPGF